MPDRILAAAYGCFDRYGVAKTTIDDIASAARVSRPTVYKYFANKDDILDRISVLESGKVTAEVRKRIVRQNTTADTLTEVVLLVVRVAGENSYVRRLVEMSSIGSHAMSPDNSVHKAYQELWGGFLNRALEAGEFAADLSLDDITSWLTSAEGMLLVRTSSSRISDADLRRFVRRFVIEPLLPHRAQNRTPSSTE